MTTMLDMETVANILGIPLQSAYSLARRGVIPAVRVGRLWRVEPRRLQEWIAAGGQALGDGWRESAA
jgi:excisionase family DNA binding protein